MKNAHNTAPSIMSSVETACKGILNRLPFL
jgi:hypothetical protein